MLPRPMPVLPRVAATALLTSASLMIAGCPKGNVAQQVADTTAPTYEQGKASKCGIRHSASKPLVVDWPSAERAALEGRAKQGLVPVRWQGCEIEVLTTCRARGEYGYVGLNPKQETVRINTADELYANLPVGAASLEGKLDRHGSLEVDMTVIGRMDSERYDFHRTELEGRCEQATHVITGLTVGAFTFTAGAGAEVSAGADFRGAGAGAASRSERELLNTDGDLAACAQATQADYAPPAGCGALLRVELVPIEGTKVVGAGDAEDASTRPKDGGGGDVDPAIDPKTGQPYDLEKLDRQIKALQITYFSGYLLGFGGIILASIGAKRLETARTSLTNSRTDLTLRSEALSDYRTGQVFVWGGVGVSVVSFGVALWGLARATKLKKQRQSIQVGAMPTRGGGQVQLEVNF